MSASNINDIAEYVKDKFKSLLKEDISDYELSVVHDAIIAVSKDIPTNKTILSERISEATKLKSGLEYMIFRLKDKRKIISMKYNPEYNKLFTLLTRQGRPSRQAIESEMYYLHPEISEMHDRLIEFDELIQYINDQISILDMIVHNLESRHYDL